MKINLTLEATFSSEENADIFLFIKSEEFGEVTMQTLTLDQILKLTLEEITDEDERIEIIGKVRNSMKKFLKKTKKHEKEQTK